MTTLIAPRPSPSSYLARPGAHLDELDEVTTTIVPGATEAAAPAGPTGPTDDEDISARETRWACEWWPPT